MKLGVVLQGVDEPEVFEAQARRIEELGYDYLFLTDSSLHSRDPYVYLALAARNTSRLLLGTAVTNPLSRHPAITAISIGTVDAVSEGRAVLGIGVGDRPLLALGHRPAKLSHLAQSVEAIRSLLEGEVVTRRAPRFQIDDGHIRLPTRIVPVFISASGPRTLQLAGEIGDGVIVLAGLFPEAIRFALDHIEEGAAKAGRPRPHVAVFAYGAVSPDPGAAMEAGRSIAAWFPQTAPHYCQLAGLDPDITDAVRRSYRGGEFQEAAEASHLLPEWFVHRMALAGGIETATQHVRQLNELGVDSVHVFPLGADRPATIEAFSTAARTAVG